jgi:glycerol uptake facilitator-like aquaporin
LAPLLHAASTGKALPGYWIVQVLGGLVAGLVILLAAKGKDGFEATVRDDALPDPSTT